MTSEEYNATVHICNRAVDIAQKLYGWSHEERNQIYQVYLKEAAESFKNKSPQFQFQLIVKSLLDRVFEDMPGGVAKNTSKTHRRWVI